VPHGPLVNAGEVAGPQAGEVPGAGVAGGHDRVLNIMLSAVVYDMGCSRNAGARRTACARNFEG